MNKYGLLLLCGLSLTLSSLKARGQNNKQNKSPKQAIQKVANNKQYDNSLEKHIDQISDTFQKLLAAESSNKQPLSTRIYDNVVDYFILPVCTNLKDLKAVKDLREPVLKLALASFDALTTCLTDMLDVIPLPKTISKQTAQDKVRTALKQAHTFTKSMLETSIKQTSLDQKDIDALCKHVVQEANTLLNQQEAAAYLDQKNMRVIKMFIDTFAESLHDTLEHYLSHKELSDLLDFLSGPIWKKMKEKRMLLIKALLKTFSDDTQKEAAKTLLNLKETYTSN